MCNLRFVYFNSYVLRANVEFPPKELSDVQPYSTFYNTISLFPVCLSLPLLSFSMYALLTANFAALQETVGISIVCAVLDHSP